MELSFFSYILFAIPGFCFVWTYRRYSNKTEKLGEFEYAAWSLIWGTQILLIFSLIEKVAVWLYQIVGFEHRVVVINLEDQFSLLGGMTGVSIGLALGISFPLGYLAAMFVKRTEFFVTTDQWLQKKIHNR